VGKDQNGGKQARTIIDNVDVNGTLIGSPAPVPAS
jgi:hypothetical protein